MDKEEARFALRCFRPDGSDATDPDFAEALQMAAADRELGDWLAKERAKDAEFSAALATLELPDGLREEILAGFAAEQGVGVEMDEFDSSLIGALAMVRPPAALRGEILAAMKRTVPAADPEVEKKGRAGWWRFALPLAAAAGVALAFVFTRGEPAIDGSGGKWVATDGGSGGAVPVSFVESHAIAALESPSFSLDLRNPDHQVLFKAIRKEGRSCPQGCIPPGLKEVPGVGCRKLEIDGKPGTIVCFLRGEGDVVHLVVFRREDVDGELPDREHLKFEQHGGWAMTQWEEKGRAFVVLEAGDKEHLKELF